MAYVVTEVNLYIGNNFFLEFGSVAPQSVQCSTGIR